MNDMPTYINPKQYGPQNPFCQQLHASKYRGPGETFRESQNRIAVALQDNEEHFQALRNILLHQCFLPGGRIQAAIGSSKQITPYNCYVSGTIEDSYIDGSGSIMARAAEAAATMRLGGGIGYDFSPLRPRGALIKKLGSHSSGPISFMEIFDAVCRATASSGHRRGAQMGVLRVDHPDVEEFVRAKHDLSRLTGFNISLAITDEFMRAVEAGHSFDLRWGGTVYRTIDARTLWDLIMRSTYDYAEPGVLFIDTINRMNNLAYIEKIAATNPCGEQPLPPYGACLLGSFNLVTYLRPDGGGGWKFDWLQFHEDVPNVVRAMDNVIDRAKYPLYEQEKEAISKRRMGLGVTGVANCIEAMGFPYGSPGFISNLEIILRGLRDSAYRASAHLAKEKGPFPLFKEDYIHQPFIQTLDEEVQEDIAAYGIRNSHLLSIAPTGTISLAADNISSGIEPVFAYTADRTVVEFGGPKVYRVEDYGYAKLGVKGRTTAQCTIGDHLRVLVAASRYVDSAVSKTCNVPTDINYESFKQIYLKAWQNGCKGCTTFRLGGKRFGILNAAEEDSTEKPVENTGVQEEFVQPGVGHNSGDTSLDGFSCSIDPVTGLQSCE